MPGKVKVKIIAGKNLPVMDRSSDTTDAYVEIKLGSTIYKTDVFRKSLNPNWNSDWFRFEVDDAELQDEPLQIRLMDYDTYSANDSIGKVFVDLNPLLLPSFPISSTRNTVRPERHLQKQITCTQENETVFSGFLPVFDTMNGIRGEVSIIVKVELFSDVNKFRQSSCGIRIFCSPQIPEGFTAKAIHGFVEELVVNDDPEYQWIDKIRTPRASNEARQTLFSKLSGEVRRKIGLKALELGGNAVIGYRQMFDLEGESGIVVRGIGTAVTLLRKDQPQNSKENPSEPSSRLEEAVKDSGGTPTVTTPSITKTQSSAAKITQRRLSESDIATTPKSSDGQNVRFTPKQASAPSDTPAALDMLEYPFFTMIKYPADFVLNFGGTVSARSVKLLEHVALGESEVDVRDVWWTELRKEVRAHARALACNAVLGYEEHTTICEGVCVLSASGTAASVNIHAVNETTEENVSSLKPCHVSHIPYSPRLLPFQVRVTKCAVCKKGWVPDLLIATVELPPKIHPIGQPVLLQARVARQYKREARGDVLAKDISDCLPFLQYELHRELINKLRLKGMNAIFGLNVQLAIGERAVVGVATGTALFLGSLPAPSLLTPLPSSGRKDAKSEDLNRRIRDVQLANQEAYGLKGVSLRTLDGTADETSFENGTDSDSDDEFPDVQLSAGNKDTCIIQVDEGEAENIKALLKDAPPPEGVQVVSLSCYPGNGVKPQPKAQVQAFTRVWRGKFAADRLKPYLDSVMDTMMQSIYFKLRKLRPCLLSHVLFSVDLPEEDQLQVTVLGNAVAVSPDPKGSRWKLKAKSSSGEADLLFNLEEEKEGYPDEGEENKNVTKKELTSPNAGIVITSLPLIPGAKIERYLGHLNFFFIRESTSIREGGGLSGFTHQFLNEVLAIVRAHVAALGGNAMVAYFMSECVLLHNPHKNQGQCLISVGGDVVYVSCVA